MSKNLQVYKERENEPVIDFEALVASLKRSQNGKLWDRYQEIRSKGNRKNRKE